jgi:hypothetical protein
MAERHGRVPDGEEGLCYGPGTSEWTMNRMRGSRPPASYLLDHPRGAPLAGQRTARALVVAEGARPAPSAIVSTNAYWERADSVGGTGICERLSARFSAATPAA